MTSRVPSGEISNAITVYDPLRTRERAYVEIVTDTVCRRALDQERYATTHLRQHGEGTIFALLGTSTAGKTSIMQQMIMEIPGCVVTGRDVFFPSHDADLVRKYAQEQYVRMARAMEHNNIAGAVFGNDICIRDDVSKEVQLDALQAIHEARQQKDSFPLVSDEELEKKMMDYVIKQSTEGVTVVYDPYDPNVLLEHMEKNNFYAPLKIGLAYCPFHVLAERVRKRNENAIASGHFEDYRSPLAPLRQFPDFYVPAKKGDTVIDTLRRDQVEEAFESSFRQEAACMIRRSSKTPRSFEEYSNWGKDYEEHLKLIKDHDQMKNEIMLKLGFTHSEIKTVPITLNPRLKGRLDYLFNTHEMKPPHTTEIIRSHL